MSAEELAEKLYNVMTNRLAELDESTKDDIEPWAECQEEGKELFRAMATFVLTLIGGGNARNL